MTERLTDRLAGWVHGLRYDDLPAKVVGTAKRQILGILGASYAGMRMSTADGLHDAVSAFGDRADATVIGGARRLKTSMRTAAMANSFLAQILEWEDWVILSHAGASVVPTALAAAEANAGSGRDLVTAIVAGNEVVGRSGEVMGDGTNLGNAVPNHQIEVPLVAGKLMGLDAARLADAVGVSCTQPQITSLHAWAAPAKGLLTGWPCYVGVTAAQLAEAGMVGSHDLLDSPLGFIGRLSDVPDRDRLELLVEGLGDDWRTETLVVKPYPHDGFAMTAIRAAIELAPQVSPEDIDEVTAYVNLPYAATATLFSEGKTDIYDRIAERRDWSYIALQYDGPHPIAAALVFGKLTWREWQEDRLQDARVRDLVARIRIVPDLVVGVWGAELVVRTTDGRELNSGRFTCIEEVDAAAKLQQGADGLIPDARIDAIVDAVEHLEDVTDVRTLTDLL